MDPGWVTAGLAVITAIIGITFWLARWLWKLGKRTLLFVDDWEGKPASPGHSPQPGVMERLQALTVQLDQAVVRMDHQDKALKNIVTEVSLNSGHSMKDTVQRTEAAVADLQRMIGQLPGVTP